MMIKNKKVFVALITIAIIVILFIAITIIFPLQKSKKSPVITPSSYSSSYSYPYTYLKGSCENSGGLWTERGTEEECKELDEKECSEKQNCMNVRMPAGLNLPMLVYIGCKHFALCSCPNKEIFYGTEGCK